MSAREQAKAVSYAKQAHEHSDTHTHTRDTSSTTTNTKRATYAADIRVHSAARLEGRAGVLKGEARSGLEQAIRTKRTYDWTPSEVAKLSGKCLSGSIPRERVYKFTEISTKIDGIVLMPFSEITWDRQLVNFWDWALPLSCLARRGLASTCRFLKSQLRRHAREWIL